MRFTTHYENKPTQMELTALAAVQGFMKDQPFIEGALHIKPKAKITVVAIQADDEPMTLSFGVSRYSECDDNEFNKKKGVEYAEWRADHAPTAVLTLDHTFTNAQIVELFHKIAGSLNEKFISHKENINLHKLPEFITHPELKEQEVD